MRSAGFVTSVVLASCLFACAPSASDEPAEEPIAEFAGEKLRVSGGMVAFNASIVPGDPNPRCATVVEVPGTYLCGWYDRDRMNDVLTRASAYAEGLGTYEGAIAKGTIVGRSDRRVRAAGIAAHDIPGAALAAFWTAAEAACKSDGGDVCPSDEERAFFEGTVLPLLDQDRPIVLLAYDAMTASSGELGSIIHELNHARYFLDAKYRDAVDRYWDGLDEEERVTIRSILADERGYDRDNEFLMKNEFQAYTLMRAWDSAEGTYGPWRRGLGSALEAAGRHRIDVH